MGQWCSASGVWSRRLLLLVRNMIKLWNSLCWLNDPCWVFTKSNSHFSPAPWVQQLKKWKEKTIAFELPIFNTTFKFLGMCVCVHACVSLLFSSERARYRSAQNEWLNSICACWQMSYKTTFPLHFSPLPVPLLSFWVLTVNNVPFDPNLFSDLNQ